jgi:peptidoglycan/LPS O-acetylase OafA/YrhL
LEATRVKENHLPALDGLRGFAALAVVLFHYHVPGFGWGWLSVDVFFALSGYVLSHVYRAGIEPREFLRARFARTIPTHLVATSALGLTVLAIGRWPDENFGTLAASLLLIGAINPPIWSLAVEWVIYILTASIGPVVSRVAGWELMIGGAAIGLLALAIVPPLPLTPAVDLPELMRGIGWFVAGVGLYRIDWRPKRNCILDSRVALWLGDVSFPLYLIHLLPSTVLRFVFDAPWLAAWIVGIPVSLAAAAALHHTIEIPARRWLRGTRLSV